MRSAVPSDPDRGSRLLAMLSLPQGARVVLLGDVLEGWEGEFANARRAASVLKAGGEALIVADNIRPRSRDELRWLMRASREALAADGYLVLLSRNFWSLDSLARAVAEVPSHRAKRESGWSSPGGPAWTERTLARSGFPVVDGYLCSPSLEDPGELIKPESEFLDFPGTLHPLYHLSWRLGILRSVHPLHLFVCGARDWREVELMRRLREAVSAFTGAAGVGEVGIGRFDIRRRGAITLFLSDGRGGAGCIGRLVSGGPRSEPVERNHTFLQAMHRSDRATAWCRSRMPREVGIVEGNGGRRIYVESLLPGILAWKAPWDQLRARILESSVEFLKRFGDAFARSVFIDETAVERLLADEFAHVRESDVLSTELRDRLLKLLNGLADRLMHTEMPLTYGHGDYGVGNVLVDPADGTLTGVIDWDTGREWELPGVDRINWEIQRIRKEYGVGFGAALRTLREEPGGGGVEETDWFHPIRAPVSESVRTKVLLAAGLRYVCRALRFPELFDEQEKDFLDGVAYLETL